MPVSIAPNLNGARRADCVDMAGDQDARSISARKTGDQMIAHTILASDPLYHAAKGFQLRLDQVDELCNPCNVTGRSVDFDPL